MSDSTRDPGGLPAGFRVNYLAVGVSVLATILVGALWYSPLLFGSLWTEATADLARAERILEAGMSDIRIGHGFDVHRFCPGDRVWLCGIAIPL